MKSGFWYSLPTLGLLSILMLSLAGCDETPKEPGETPKEPGETPKKPVETPKKPVETPKKPGVTFKDCDTCPEMVVIPAGSFRMGEWRDDGNSHEKPRHEVKISYSFAVGKYEVTQAEWEAVRAENPSEFKGAQKPVENVSWEDVKSFVKKLSEQTGKEYRLLSESEWEYMASAGSRTFYHWGDEVDGPYEPKARYNSEDGTVRVGQYGANAFGVHDTAGNVTEWVEDCRHQNYIDAPIDGSAWLSASGGDCKKRVIRGGSWGSRPEFLRSAYRSWGSASSRSFYYGFRVARTLSQ